VTIDGRTITFEEAQRINKENQAQAQALQWEAQNASNAYWKKSQDVTSAINVLSPVSDYQDLSSVIINNQKPWDPTTSQDHMWRQTKISLWDSLGYKWGSLVSLIVMAFAAFAVSYVAFMRTDVR
jgi:ABC-type transport system involved in multi-copper enzyme maturation permease subunit